jgi:hypothetical protein
VILLERSKLGSIRFVITLGSLKDDLIAAGKLEDTKEAIHAKIWADYNAQ